MTRAAERADDLLNAIQSLTPDEKKAQPYLQFNMAAEMRCCQMQEEYRRGKPVDDIVDWDYYMAEHLLCRKLYPEDYDGELTEERYDYMHSAFLLAVGKFNAWLSAD